MKSKRKSRDEKPTGKTAKDAASQEKQESELNGKSVNEDGTRKPKKSGGKIKKNPQSQEKSGVQSDKINGDNQPEEVTPRGRAAKRLASAPLPEKTPVKRSRSSKNEKNSKQVSGRSNKKNMKNDPPIYEVEKILKAKGKKPKEKYLIKWVGYPESENSWEPKRNLSNCRELLQEFLKG